MRNFLIPFLAIALQSVCIAGGTDSIPILVPDNAAGVTNSVTSGHAWNGFIESIYVEITAPATQTVVIATAQETLLTLTGITASDTYRPVYPVVDSAGAAVGTITNVATKCLLVNEPITVTVTSTQTNVLPVTVIPKTRQ